MRVYACVCGGVYNQVRSLMIKMKLFYRKKGLYFNKRVFQRPYMKNLSHTSGISNMSGISDFSPFLRLADLFV